MTHKAKVGLEPVTGADLEKYFDSIGATFARQTGSHRFWKLRDGTLVGTLRGDNQPVPSSLLRTNAQAMGISYRRLRERLGHPVQVTRKPTFKPDRQADPRPVTKRALTDMSGEVMELASAIHEVVRHGQRDQRFMQETLGHLQMARGYLRDVTLPGQSPAERAG